MLSATSTGSASASCMQGQTGTSRPAALSRHQQLACVPRRRRSVAPVRAFGSAMAMSTDSFSTASTIASAIGVALGVGFVAREVMLEEARAAEAAAQRDDACPSCQGKGYEPCVCRRWSDGDVGCSACNRSGMMVCRSCRGGGTGVPIRVTVRKQ